MADVLDVAAAVVDEVRASGVDRSLTAKKLEKLVYYSQAWFLAEAGAPLFDDPIEAWRQGPVVRRLWQCHRGRRFVEGIPFGNPARLSSSQLELVRRVVDRYGRLSAERLSDLTHRELPWRQARGNLPHALPSSRKIELDELRKAYVHGGASPSDAVELAVANSRLEGLKTNDAMRSVLSAVARSETNVEDAVRARIRAIQA